MNHPIYHGIPVCLCPPKSLSMSRFQRLFNFGPSTDDILHTRYLNMNSLVKDNTEKIALEIYLPQQHVLTFISCKIPDCLNINIDSTLDLYKVFRQRIYTEPGSEQDLDRYWS